MNDWKLEKLGNITLKIGSGATPSGGKNVYLDNGIPLIRSQNIYNGYFNHSGLAFLSERSAKELDNVIVQKNDNLINITGDSVCRSTIVPDNLINSRVNQHVMIIRPIQQVLHYRYLHYFLISPNTQKKLYSFSDSGGTRKALTKEMVSDLEIPLPSFKTQQKIADILGSLDDKIELNRQMNQTLEAMARAIFKSWFVDFDPVYAKMEGRDYPLPPEIMDLFPDELEESELGLIPKGWRVSTIGEEVEVVGGGTPSTKNLEFWEDGIHHFATPKDLSNLESPILIDTERKVTEKGLNKISSGLLPPGTLLMSSRAPVGYLAIAEIPVCINQGFIAMKCNKTLSNYYMLNWAKTYMDDIKGRASGTTFAEISKANFRPMKILVPNKDLIWIFEQRSVPLFEKIINNLKQNLIVTNLRDNFLLKFFNEGAKF